MGYNKDHNVGIYVRFQYLRKLPGRPLIRGNESAVFFAAIWSRVSFPWPGDELQGKQDSPEEELLPSPATVVCHILSANSPDY